MRLDKLLSASVLSLLLFGTTTVLYAQEQHEDTKPQEETRPETKPQKPDQDKQDQDKKTVRDEDKAAKQDDAKASKQAEQDNQHGAKQSGGRIPDDKFRANFGRQHTFVVNHVNTVGGRPQFQYGGYSFTIVEVWPAGWAYTDQCYIDYIDGQYFLFDLLHPGVQVALVVVL